MVEFRVILRMEIQKLPLSVLYPLWLWIWVVFFIQCMITWALITLYIVKQWNGFYIALCRVIEGVTWLWARVALLKILLAMASSPFAIMGHEFSFIFYEVHVPFHSKWLNTIDSFCLLPESEKSRLQLVCQLVLILHKLQKQMWAISKNQTKELKIFIKVHHLHLKPYNSFVHKLKYKCSHSQFCIF